MSFEPFLFHIESVTDESTYTFTEFIQFFSFFSTRLPFPIFAPLPFFSQFITYKSHPSIRHSQVSTERRKTLRIISFFSSFLFCPTTERKMNKMKFFCVICYITKLFPFRFSFLLSWVEDLRGESRLLDNRIYWQELIHVVSEMCLTLFVMFSGFSSKMLVLLLFRWSQSNKTVLSVEPSEVKISERNRK